MQIGAQAIENLLVTIFQHDTQNYLQLWCWKKETALISDTIPFRVDSRPKSILGGQILLII
jgi:hypothetical protein